MLAVLSDINPESVFGGIVLLAVIVLLISGKLRTEREVQEKDEIISLKDMTIKEQADTINTLLHQAELTNNILQELRSAAFSNAPPNGGNHHDV